MSLKDERLKLIQTHINEYWESLDKESLLMEILEDKLSDDELHQLMLDQDIPQIFK